MPPIQALLPLLLALASAPWSPLVSQERASAAPQGDAAASPLDDLLGCWRGVEDSAAFLWLEEQRVARLRGPEPTFHRVEYAAGDTGVVATLERWARFESLELRLEGDVLVVADADGRHRFERSHSVPETLRVPPYELPEDVPVDAGLVQILQDDLARRHAEDQRVRTNPAARDEMARVDSENTAFLLTVVEEVGWIDAERFGAEASEAAFLLVQHSADLRLQATALPYIQRDVEAERLDGQSYALLYDRLQLRLGRLQRYGSQVGVTADGTSVLMPCEAPERVDEHRAALGMAPLADYLALFEENGSSVLPLQEVASRAGD